MTTEVQGSCAEPFELVRAEFAENLQSGEELGGSIFIDLDGETVVDLWGGYRDVQQTIPWTEDTITNVWSSTKTVTNLAALLLVERGLLDVYTPVAQYWPEFAANGKQDIEVRHLMAHTSGVSGWEQPFATEDMYDWAASTARLAAQPPWWEPGTASGYHAHNQGHLIGEVIRRITGKTLKQFVADELAGPLGADFQIGAREVDWERIADVVPPPPLPFDLDALDSDSPMYKTFLGPPANAAAANTPAWRHADMGALNGHGNARSVARMLSPVARGGVVDGVRLLSAATIDLIFEEQANGADLVLGVPLRWGIGYALPQPGVHPEVPLPGGRICFWGGWGGSMIIMDLDRRMTIAYMMNKMAPGIIGSVRSAAYLRAAYRAVGVEPPVAGTPTQI